MRLGPGAATASLTDSATYLMLSRSNRGEAREVTSARYSSYCSRWRPGPESAATPASIISPGFVKRLSTRWRERSDRRLEVLRHRADDLGDVLGGMKAHALPLHGEIEGQGTAEGRAGDPRIPPRQGEAGQGGGQGHEGTPGARGEDGVLPVGENAEARR